MKLRFGFLLVLLIPAAFAAGWCLGGRSEDARVAAILREREAEIETVAHALNAATFINSVFQTTDIGSPGRRNEQRNNLLIGELLFLARAEPCSSADQRDTFLMHADRALTLLRVENQDEFVRAVEESGLVDSVKAPFLDHNNVEYKLATDFVRRAFDRQRSQPTYPARLWLRAIVNEDSDLLKSAYSHQVASGDEDWQERLEGYGHKLASDLREFDPYRFGFGYSVSSNREGAVNLSYGGKEYRTFRIIHEPAGWRLDQF